MPAFDSNPASQLCFDLLQMYLNNLDTDITLLTKDDSKILAHKSVFGNYYNKSYRGQIKEGVHF